MENPYQADIVAILSHRHDNGADLWATPDKRLLKGSPFSTVDCVMYLLELGLPPDAPVLKEAADLIFSTWRPDGRFRKAFAALEKKTQDGQIVVERVVPKLARLSFCRKGEASERATRRYREIPDHLGR